VIRKTIIDRDGFGLDDINNNQQPSGRREFAYDSDGQKIAYFLQWLRKTLDSELIQLTNQNRVSSAWFNRFIDETYHRGVQRARTEMQKQGMDVPDIEDEGGIGFILGRPQHSQMINTLRYRVLNELEGFKNDILHYTGRVLSDSFQKGHGRYEIVKRINTGLFEGEDREDLGLTELIGMFVAFSRRSDMIARSEIVRIINEAALTEYEMQGIERVGVDIELIWTTAGDQRVCNICRRESAQSPYTIEEARGKLPRHVGCRCFWLPVRKEQLN
jgi:hypothetical protein